MNTLRKIMFHYRKKNIILNNSFFIPVIFYSVKTRRRKHKRSDIRKRILFPSKFFFNFLSF